MKINRLEAHDRLGHLRSDQSINVSKGAEDCLKKNSLSLKLQEKSPYIYLFAHPRTCDDGVTKKMFWQPRLTKPKPQTNSYLFRAISNSDTIEICWLLPPREMWSQYEDGKVTANPDVMWSIDQFVNHRAALEKSDPEDLSEAKAKSIYLEVAKEMDQEKMFKPKILEAF